jgi:hypothetical protein
VVRAAIVLAVVSATTPAFADFFDEPARPVRTWLSNDEMFTTFDANGQWASWGAGLGLHRELVGHLEIGVEGQALRIDARDDDDFRHGLGLRGALTAAYGFGVSRFATIDFRVAPEIGVASSVVYGIGMRYVDETFAGVRLSFRRGFETVRGARGIGGHLGFRTSRTADGIGFAFSIGYDWGL